MKKIKAKIFICAHPDNLLIYKNLVRVIRQNTKDTEIILLKVNHPYFLKLDFEPYRKYFDKIIEFDFIHYEKNILVGFWKIAKFINKIRKIESTILAGFQSIDLFLIHSTWLPTNILNYQLSKNKKIGKITRFIIWNTEHQQTKIDRLRTFFCRLYSLFFGSYRVNVTKTMAGQFAGFVFTGKIAGTPIKIVSPMQKDLNYPEIKQNDIFPYPIISEAGKNQETKKDMVIIFGDESAIHQYHEYFSDPGLLNEKLIEFFQNIENHYSDCELYYKPHPSDGEKIMPGIGVSKYNLFDNSTNAEAIFEKYHKRIKAVYSLSSTSVMIGSFFGIPSYAFYKYLFNPQGIEKLGSIFNQDSVQSDFLFHITDLKQIGQIDNLECWNFNHIDLENINEIYFKMLNI